MEDEDVKEAVVVEVVDAGSPTHVLRVGLRDSVRRADVVKTRLPCVTKEAIVVAVRHPEIENSAAFEIGEHRTHGGCGFAVLPECGGGIVSYFLEGSIMLVVEEEVFGAVVGHIDVIPTVPV